MNEAQNYFLLSDDCQPAIKCAHGVATAITQAAITENKKKLNSEHNSKGIMTIFLK